MIYLSSVFTENKSRYKIEVDVLATIPSGSINTGSLLGILSDFGCP